MDSVPPAHGPARRLDDLLADLGVDADTDLDTDPDGPPADLPEVVEAVTGRARDLHRLADRLSADGAGEGDATLSAVALLRAHAGKVDDLAEHLATAGSDRTTTATTATEPGSGRDEPPTGPRGVPRSVG
jgi:hypothetical protein